MPANARVLTTIVALLLIGSSGAASERYTMKGMVLKIDPSRRSFLVSHDSVPGVMEAMTMSFDVRRPESLDGVEPGMTVEFTLILAKDGTFAEEIRVRRYQPSEQDPLAAQRLKLLERLNAMPAAAAAVRIGQPVPDFALIDQARQTVRLSQFRGKVVAVNFIYTSCALPQFCFRMANHFSAVNRRFKDRMGRDLVLLTVTFDPVRDQPEKLAAYARQWTADPSSWHFLTGDVADVQRVCNLFGLDFFPDEGLMNHSSHTALIDRRGDLVANIEGAQFTATELRDLVQTVLNQ